LKAVYHDSIIGGVWYIKSSAVLYLMLDCLRPSQAGLWGLRGYEVVSSVLFEVMQELQSNVVAVHSTNKAKLIEPAATVSRVCVSRDFNGLSHLFKTMFFFF